MKKATLKLAGLVLLLAGTITEAYAQSGTGQRDPRVVTTAVPFLRISPDARSGAMGETGIATSADGYMTLILKMYFWHLLVVIINWMTNKL